MEINFDKWQEEKMREYLTQVFWNYSSSTQDAHPVRIEVQCDSELNTPDVIDRNEMRAKIKISNRQPIKCRVEVFE